MPWIALAAYLMLLGVGFGWQSWRQYRRTGDSGMRVTARAGSAQWWAKLLFIGTLTTGVSAPAAAIVGLPDLTETRALHWLGLVVVVAVLVLIPLTQSAMGGSWRVGVDSGESTSLVTGGPFRYVRNPVFTLMVAAQMGVALLVPNPIALSGVALIVAGVQVQVRLVEEPYLLRMHSEAYRAYATATGRFVPRIGRRASWPVAEGRPRGAPPE